MYSFLAYDDEEVLSYIVKNKKERKTAYRFINYNNVSSIKYEGIENVIKNFKKTMKYWDNYIDKNKINLYYDYIRFIKYYNQINKKEIISEIFEKYKKEGLHFKETNDAYPKLFN